MVLEITGVMLRTAIERSAEYFTLADGQREVSDAFLKPKAEHCSYDYNAGVNYLIDAARRAPSAAALSSWRAKERRRGRQSDNHLPEQQIRRASPSYRRGGKQEGRF